MNLFIDALSSKLEEYNIYSNLLTCIPKDKRLKIYISISRRINLLYKR